MLETDFSCIPNSYKLVIMKNCPDSIFLVGGGEGGQGLGREGLKTRQKPEPVQHFLGLFHSCRDA